MTKVDQILIFDVDGVITNPQTKRITEPEILDELIKKLKDGKVIVLNTGRSFDWLIDRVINPLLQKLHDRSKLGNFFAVGEFGGVWMTIDQNGELNRKVDSSLVIPTSLKNQARTLVQNNYSESMFYDESKLTIISIEMIDGFSLEEYKKHQKKVVFGLKEILNQNEFLDLKIHADSIAVNIMNKKAGKKFAMGKIMDWLRKKNINPAKFITFGDSYSDIPMAEELNSKGHFVEFVYVGRETIDTSKYPFPIIITKEKYGKGTLEFLKSL